MSKQVTTIIRADINDVAAIVPLFDQYRQFYNQQSDFSNALNFITNRLDKHESVIFLALKGTRSVGFVQLYPLFSSIAMKRLWVLNDLFVVEEFRGQGIGTALVEQSKKFAKKTRAKGLLLETAKDNIKAQKLYERLGWKKEENVFYSLDV